MSVFKPFKSSDMIISPLRVSKGFTYQGILPTYTLTSNKSSYDEGEKVILTLNTTYIPDNTILPFTMSGNEDFRNDIILFPVKEEFKVVNGVATFEFFIKEDLTTEGEETINIALNNGGANIDITINDTSLAPVIYPIYTINSSSTVNEGQTISVNISTSHPELTAGTMVFLTHSGISLSDYTTNLPAAVVLDSNGSISYGITIENDDTTEGSEVLTISINSSQLPIYDSVNSILTTSTIINDTSLDIPVVNPTSLEFNTCLLDMGGVGECGTNLVPDPAIIVLKDTPTLNVNYTQNGNNVTDDTIVTSSNDVIFSATSNSTGGVSYSLIYDDTNSTINNNIITVGDDEGEFTIRVTVAADSNYYERSVDINIMVEAQTFTATNITPLISKDNSILWPQSNNINWLANISDDGINNTITVTWFLDDTYGGWGYGTLEPQALACVYTDVPQGNPIEYVPGVYFQIIEDGDLSTVPNNDIDGISSIASGFYTDSDESTPYESTLQLIAYLPDSSHRPYKITFIADVQGSVTVGNDDNSRGGELIIDQNYPAY